MAHQPSPCRVRNYRRTLGDRYGGDIAQFYRAAGWAAAGATMVIPAAALISSGWTMILVGAALFVMAWLAIMVVTRMILSPPSAVVKYVLAPTGESTPYEEQFSQEDALVMQERVPEALALFEQRIAAEPGAIRARIKAADLYAGLGRNPRRAAELFVDAQRLPGLASGQDMYIGNRLADLYLGPLHTPARAFRELRRLLDRYPDSRSAPQLREALSALKAQFPPDQS